ncbi:TIR domain-containing protein [Sphingomonas sp.]|uniref:TIR domain-containing protein n=1 Tax=Sphingomonas sp. TaxID=28214 RepID=UPI00286EA94C|nr:TIR domain-containing protein [Sphingomonas sp.]
MATPTDQSDAAATPVTVFVSYAHPDAERANVLVAALREAGVTVWWDGLIEAGAGFAESIEAALEQADAVIVLWSKHSVGSDWVRDEAARGRERKRLVPITLDGCQPPLGFRQYQTVDLSAWRGRKDAPPLPALLQRLAALAGQEAPLASTPVLAQPHSRRALLAAGGVILVAGGGVAAWRSGLVDFGGGEDSASVAVIPFANLGGDPAQSYFSDGLSEQIRAELARNQRLRVLARTSSNTARGHREDAITVARKLGVAFLLEGSVRRSGPVLRIAADLIDGKTGFSRWSNSFDRNIDSIFEVQSEIARTVTEALSLELGAAEPAPGGTRDVAAYEAFLRGRDLFLNATDEPADRAALAQYDAAIAADPKFAMAHAGRARSLAAIAAEYAKAEQLKPLYADAIAAARRAVALAPGLAEANLALGYALFAGRLDVAAAKPFYDRAYAQGGGNADILLLYALYCSRAGRAGEARRAVAKAVQLDPLNPRAFRAEGSIAYAARDYPAALPPLARALQLKPDLAITHSYVGSALLMMGKAAEAKEAFAKEPNVTFSLAGLAIAERRLGNAAAADAALARMRSELGDASLYQQAEVLAQWGNVDGALASLERAKAVGDSGLIYLATDPLLDPLRKQPRFAALQANLAST